MVHVRCVVIGGGTGSFSILSGLKYHVSNISALVGMADDGGSSGMLRDDMGVLPPGDIRQCLVALSDAPEDLRRLFNYRYQDGVLEGHSFGNVFLSTVEKMTNNFADAVHIASDVLRIHGKVVPITLDDVRLVVEWDDGTAMHGEGRIDSAHFAKDKGKPALRLEPEATLNPAAREALLQADVVVIAPGDIYTSLGALLVVGGVKEALAATRAKVIYVSNLVNKPGHTDGFTVSDHAAEIERFVDGEPILDYVLYNTAEPPAYLIEKYMREGETIVQVDSKALAAAHYQAVGVPLVATISAARQPGDQLALNRSYIRHDSEALAQALVALINK